MAIQNENMTRAAKARTWTYNANIDKSAAATLNPGIINSRKIILRKFNVVLTELNDTTTFTFNIGTFLSASAYGSFVIPIDSPVGNYEFTSFTLREVPAGSEVMLRSLSTSGTGNAYVSIEYDIVDDIPSVVN